MEAVLVVILLVTIMVRGVVRIFTRSKEHKDG